MQAPRTSQRAPCGKSEGRRRSSAVSSSTPLALGRSSLLARTRMGMPSTRGSAISFCSSVLASGRRSPSAASTTKIIPLTRSLGVPHASPDARYRSHWPLSRRWPPTSNSVKSMSSRSKRSTSWPMVGAESVGASSPCRSRASRVLLPAASMPRSRTRSCLLGKSLERSQAPRTLKPPRSVASREIGSWVTRSLRSERAEEGWDIAASHSADRSSRI
mmetsp:Transcript_6463/g.13362  ORF Transcript_6463/g.13362 Transcript_6463/m.13362 type:complete len:217 (-) Transcript_6463:431-1081(-)